MTAKPVMYTNPGAMFVESEYTRSAVRSTTMTSSAVHDLRLTEVLL